MGDDRQGSSGTFDFPGFGGTKVFVFLGAYGSGKSEVAVNTALALSERDRGTGFQTVLADLDIINPYYRSFDAAAILAAAGVRVIASSYANTNVDVPAVPGEAYSVFDRPDIRAVLDIGGEDMGARIVSVLRDRIASVTRQILMVVNVSRPFTATAPKIADMMRELEGAAGIAVTGIVNNTNLLGMTDPADLLEAGSILADVTDRTGVPVVFAAGDDGLYPAAWGASMPDGLPFLRLRRTIRYPE